MGYKEAYESWLSDPYFDEETKAELLAIKDNEKEIEDRFYMDLEFGTAGLRGVIGAGTNRMNYYTVRKATQGLANYILSVGTQDKGVAIAYDSRNMSPEFAHETALCLAANGIKAYIFPSLRPVPMLSFTVRKLGCTAGVVITASHNPPEYNGYKVYWDDGAQITPPHDAGIMAKVREVTDYATVKTMDEDAAKEAGLYVVLDEAIDDAYIAELKKLVLNPEIIKKQADQLKIVYTPLHGSGNMPVRRILNELGFKHVFVVPEQEQPDGNFPTVSYPNPEAAEAFDLGLKLAHEVGADLVLATDPDADRLGVYVKDANEDTYHPLTGNMSGCLIGAYEISQKKEKFGLPADGAFIKSIVSTNLADAIAADNGVQLIEVLTGFKFIGRKMLEFDEQHTGTYLFGMEESYGCLPGTYARDKDAVAASMVLCEAAAFYKEQGKTLWDAMVELYERYGYYQDAVESITLKGKEGIEKIQSIMEEIRNNPPVQIGDYAVERFRDYKTGIIKDIKNGTEEETGLPSSNVLYFDLPDAAWVVFRPSGTEPKLKYYFGVRGDSMDGAKQKSDALGLSVRAIIDGLM